jgi:hypothetical protein
MKKLILNLLFLIFISTNVYSSDLVYCNGNCQSTCSSTEKLAVSLLDSAAQDLLKKFQLNEESSDNLKMFIENLNYKMNNLALNKKTLSENCLDRYCEQPGKKNMKLDLGMGVSISYTNPICDYSAPNRNPPINLLMIRLENEKGSLAQITYNKNDSSFGLMIKSPTMKCNDNEGGTFDNKIVVSLNSLAVVPNEGSTQVKNTPVGAQILRKKKFLPKISFDSANNLNFNLGDGYESTIDLSTNTMKSNSLLVPNCKGTIMRNPAKGTSRLALNPTSINSRGSKVYDSNNYKLIETDSAKVPW